jgi:hypothetical protein
MFLWQVLQRSQQEQGDASFGATSLSTLRPKPTVAPVVPMWGGLQGEEHAGVNRDAEELRREFDDVIQNLEQRRADFEASTLEATKAKALQAKVEEEIRCVLTLGACSVPVYEYVIVYLCMSM